MSLCDVEHIILVLYLRSDKAHAVDSRERNGKGAVFRMDELASVFERDAVSVSTQERIEIAVVAVNIESAARLRVLVGVLGRNNGQRGLVFSSHHVDNSHHI